jgi:gamma-glutamyl-gamma-aminobutyrate hydrolase PuuD
MLVAPPKGSCELELYIQWLKAHNLTHTLLTSDVTKIDQPLLLCGGADVGVNKTRDRLEFRWIRSAIENGQPIIGICRGMQLLNVYFGGIVKSLDDAITESHRLDSFEDDDDHGERISQFHGVVDNGGNKLMVNSRHHQYCSRVAKNFKVTYKSIEGGMIPEAFEDRKRMIYAVQWHPERFESEDNSIPLTYILKQNINNL